MNTSSVTLTREDWNRLHDGLDALREDADGLSDLAEALELVGMTRPAIRLLGVISGIALQSIALAEILTQADGGPEQPDVSV